MSRSYIIMNNDFPWTGDLKCFSAVKKIYWLLIIQLIMLLIAALPLCPSVGGPAQTGERFHQVQMRQ